MAVPGSNLLNMALRIIAGQNLQYYQALDREVNAVGQDVTTYAAPVPMYGSIQPVPRTMYETYGLDFQKTYYNFYTSNNVIDVGRDLSGDQLVFNNQRYQCESNDDWYVIDGWKGILCVKIEDNAVDVQLFGFDANLNFDNAPFVADDN